MDKRAILRVITQGGFAPRMAAIGIAMLRLVLGGIEARAGAVGSASRWRTDR